VCSAPFRIVEVLEGTRDQSGGEDIR
jgi:hypothetical protein